MQKKKLFKALQKIDLDWIVFHSLSMGSHIKKVFGEIDFVIVCKEGILCLEIKGGAVFREDGIWHFQDRFGNTNTSTEGPFKQVIGNMFSLQKYIKEKIGYQHPLSRCQYASGVVFPDIAFNRKGPDIIQEIIYDDRYTDEEIVSYVQKTFSYWRENTKEKHGFEGNKLSKIEINQAENILRGDFACVPTLGKITDEIDKRLIVLTEEQYNYFKMISVNKRILINGGAGTGKTLLALEHAKQLASMGKRVLYLCYNKLISQYLKISLADIDKCSNNIELTNFHEYISRFIKTSDIKEFNQQQFFKKIMPERFIELTETNTLDEKFDVLIIDEGQDLLTTEYLFCLDELLKGGLREGSWYVFYDSNQNIYNTYFDEGYSLLQECQPTILYLQVNCRNTKQIGTYNMLMTGLKQEEILKVDGENVQSEGYDNNKELQSKVVKVVKKLKSEGIKLKDIVILSPYSFEKSALEGNDIFKSICTFQNISSMKFKAILDDSIKFSTIQSFKGMESKVIILIDFDRFADPNIRLINYTGISRAKALLYIFYKNDAATEMQEVIMESIEKYSV